MFDDKWISATRTRNFAGSETLLDWLTLYGKKLGYKTDDQYPGYDIRTDFSHFIMNKGLEFEQAVAKHISTLVPIHEIKRANSRVYSQTDCDKTMVAMALGKPIIYQAVLKHDKTKTYGVADFLIRSDELSKLFPASISDAEVNTPAPNIPSSNWHYRVIDVKFTTLHFLTKGDLSSSNSAWGYMHQIFIYNQALGEMQGYTAPGGYLLGRKWEQTIEKQKERSTNCMDRLAFIPADTAPRGKDPLAISVAEACNWIRKVRTEGKNWEIFPEPTVPELRPNMGSTNDQPWHRAKTGINSKLKDLTELWYVGSDKRDIANNSGIYRWDEKDYKAEDLGVRGVKTAPVLQKIIDINRSNELGLVWPPRISNSDQGWRNLQPLEFYVDFETVSDLDDDFKHLPQSGGQPMIFMIGCGHIENEIWKWSCFTVNDLSQESEAKIIESWLNHMGETKFRLGLKEYEAPVYHWSHAETTTFEGAFNSAKNRHRGNNWATPNWYDFLKLVVKKEPLVVKGSFGFGLKSVATSLKNLGHIETSWDSGPTDGLGAMVGAWSAAEETERSQLQESTLTREIEKYNEVDCKVMMEIIKYLRETH